MGKLDDLYNFREKRFTAYNHSLRIYIHGVEVSRWLRGSLSITYNGRDSYNNASFEIVNPRHIFQITEENLCGPTGKCSESPKMREGDHEYSEAAKAKVFAMKQRLNGQAKNLVFDTLNSGLIVKGAALATESYHSVSGADPFAFNKFFPPKTYEETRYRLYVSDCIFNKNDYVRIFQKNPFQAYKDEWVEIFCGFIQDKPVTTNYITGESRLNVSCSCIKQIMQKMRVNINVHLADIDHGTQIKDQDFYNDFLNPSKLTHPFAQSNLENTIKTLILGSPNPERDPAKMTAEEKKSKVGEFKLGNIVCYDPSNPGNMLERWHLMTVFGVNKVPFPQGGNQDDLWLTGQEMNTIGKATRTGKDADAIVGGPSARYLHMLLPKSGTGPGSLIQYDLVKSASAADRREWSTRWEIIRDFASKLDFQVLTSPSGDILVEFPQYGFTPCAYLTNFNSGAQAEPDGTVGDSAKAAKKSKSSPLSGSSEGKGSKKAFQQCHVGRPDGSYDNAIANLFLYKIHIKEETLNDEAEDFPTLLQVSGGFAFQGGAVPSAKQEVLNPRAILYSPVLVARYGAISESVDFPFAGQRKDEFGDDKAAFTKRLVKLGMIEFVRRMADASTWQGSLVYRPFQFPNRPVHLRRCHRMGLTSKVSYTYNVGKDVSMSMDCHMLMARRHDGSYRLMTGSVNTPIDYGAIWDSTDATTKDGGVVATTSDQAKTDGVTTSKEAESKTPENQKTNPPSDKAEVPEGLMPEFKSIVENMIAASKTVFPDDPLKLTALPGDSLGLRVQNAFPNDLSYFQRIREEYKSKYNPTNNPDLTPDITLKQQKGESFYTLQIDAPNSWGSVVVGKEFAEITKSKKSELSNEEVKQKTWDFLRAKNKRINAQAGGGNLPKETPPPGDPNICKNLSGDSKNASGAPGSTQSTVIDRSLPKKAADYIRKAEGEVTEVYPDAVKKATIGIGHLLTNSERDKKIKERGYITKEEMEEIFAEDLKSHSEYFLNNVKVPLTDDQKVALASFGFNAGGASPAMRNIVKLINEGKSREAMTKVLLDYDKGTKDGVLIRLAGLTARRAEEASLFCGEKILPDVAATPSVPCEGTSFLKQRGLKVS